MTSSARTLGLMRTGLLHRRGAHRALSRRASYVASLVGLLFAFSCGSKTSETPAAAAGAAGGPSTTTGCAPGDTRTCVGPGACHGGQTCGNDAHWSSCDCGVQNSGGSSSSAGAAATSGGVGVAGSSGQSVGGFTDIAGATADAGAGNEAGAANQSSGDEPCPSSAISVDCSGQCGDKPAVCDKPCFGSVALSSISPGMVLARTPSHVGSNPAYAVSNCHCQDPAETQFAYEFTVGFSQSSTATASHVSVPAPWYLYNINPLGCAPPADLYFGCVNTNVHGFIIWTTDPNAPAVNLKVEPGPCP
jgi:hypothetical protein